MAGSFFDPLRGRGASTAIALSMLAYFGGNERTPDELAAPAADAGLVLRDTAPVADGRTLLEFGARP